MIVRDPPYTAEEPIYRPCTPIAIEKNFEAPSSLFRQYEPEPSFKDSFFLQQANFCHQLFEVFSK
jgi:hypothetical protein